MEYFHISSHNNTIDEVRLLLDPNCKIVLSQQARERIFKSREYLDNQMLKAKEPIYGINTGFGSLCNVKVDSDQLSQLQVNLVMSHACGLGGGGSRGNCEAYDGTQDKIPLIRLLRS